MQINAIPYFLEFSEPFSIAAGTRMGTPSVFVKINKNNITGYGAASMPPYLEETTESVTDFMEKAKTLVGRINNISDIAQCLQDLDALAPGNTAAKAAIDIALHDLIGKEKQQPCYKLFGIQELKLPSSFHTLSINKPEIIKKKVIAAKGVNGFKVKLGSKYDKEIVSAIRSVTDVPICIDVNQGWKTKEEAAAMIDWLENKKILFIEQPLPKEDKEGQRWLYQRSQLPLIADEGVQREKDMDEVAEMFHGINIKLMKCTGLNEAHRMIKKARDKKMKVMIGCMSESVCAITAIAHLSPLADYADLDGALTIINDPFDGLKIENEKVFMKDIPGIGIELKKDIFLRD